MHGTYDGQTNSLRFERRFPHPPERVWAAITEPEELRHWFPAPDEVARAPVVECDAPRVFEFRWEDDRLRFEIEPDGDGCRLVFTHFIAQRDQGAMVAAGWHVCFDLLAERLDGGAPGGPSPEPTPEWERHYAAYRDRGVPAGAPVPGA